MSSYNRASLAEALAFIDPANLEYSEWAQVGMALKHEGFAASDWEAWSARDPGRFHPGECLKKWETFREDSGDIVTGGTILHLAKRGGWQPSTRGEALSWDAIITEDYVVVDPDFLDVQEFKEPAFWNPKRELITYLETLFQASDIVGYVCRSYDNGDRRVPSKGVNSRTAGELIEAIEKSDTIADALGDYDETTGAWIRFNPLDGKGGKNVNVTDFRFALVESDDTETDIAQQRAMLEALELPIAAMVYSGGKSVHAIVKVDAADYHEYKKRVDYLYKICEKNGIKVDQQNKNPSRLSRMPGVMRGERKQFLMATNVGRATWAEWAEWIESVNDDLPDPETLASVWEELPPLAPALINGVLRQGHKMLLAGPSKAGKSFLLIQLVIAIAEGLEWLGWKCTRGKVLYVNLELDKASAFHRFKDVYEAKGIIPKNINNIDVWNLRGKSTPLDTLAPKLIRRAQKKGYIAVVIDPIYKVITGDENSASEMAKFANQFDKIATELGTAVIYCHHHSKGYQGGKRSMDRASGSGVFARDPDALLDLTELEIPPRMRRELMDKARAGAIADTLATFQPDYYTRNVEPGEEEFINCMKRHAGIALLDHERQKAEHAADVAEQATAIATAWRLEGTLREFASFKPKDIFFSYPIHSLDEDGVLEELKPEAEKQTWERAMEGRKTKEEKEEERRNELEVAFQALEMEGLQSITMDDLANRMQVAKRTVRRRIKEHGGFEVSRPGSAPGTVKRIESVDQFVRPKT